MTKDEIKQSVTMQEILSRYGIKQNRVGFICCPFHRERTASCKIYEDSFYCFGCGIGGDIFDFIMRYESVPFSTAFIELILLILGSRYPFETGIPMGAFLKPILLMSTAMLSENAPSSTMPLFAEAVWMERTRIFVFCSFTPVMERKAEKWKN